jgi:uroporphyrinogen decarboxylase
MMTGKERILRALSLQEPDQVPVMEWVIAPNIKEQLCQTTSDLVFVRQMGMDGVAVGLDMKNIKVDDRHAIDEWGIKRVTYDEYPNPVGFPIQSSDDLDILLIPDPHASYRFDKIKTALKEVGDDICVVPRVRDVFSQPRDLMGFENFLVSFYEDPDLANYLMKVSAEYSCQICNNLADLGIQVIVIGDDYANNDSMLMNPNLFREMVMPHLTKLVQHAKKLGLKVIKHSDGDLRSILPDLLATGIDCLDPIDERGHMHLADIKRSIGHQIALKGNIDCVSTLVDQPVAQVRRETARCILHGSRGGGHIISSSNSVHSGVCPENYRVFLETVKELGRYPLNIELLDKVANGAE